LNPFARTTVQDVVCCLLARAGFDRAAAGVLGASRRLADSLGGKLRAVLLGPIDDALAQGAAAVADSVAVVDQPLLAEYNPELYLSALTAVCKPLEPAAILLGNDTYSQELAPRLAHRLAGSSAGDAVEVAADGDKVRATRGVYGGKATAVIALARRPAVVWVRARAMAPADASGRPVGEMKPLAVDLPADPRVKVVSRQVEAKEGVRLEDARLIVSGGRGLGGPEPFKQLQALAATMGAEMAASRAACDAGWVPPSWQVGQTGKKVAPVLYMAIAISGASQHIMGIADAKVICAINRDPDAPIFKHCRFGLVEDYQKVVGPLREKLSHPT
jgi:electron transfer flavoprotein alpha subunit